MSKKNEKVNIKLRFNALTVFTYIIGIILIIQLFNLQIVKGEEYREQSNTRLTRESTLEAARGEILARTGDALVTSSMRFTLEMYKTKIDTIELNKAILNIINVLEKYQISYIDSFPIKTEPFEYTISEETLLKWKTSNNIKQEVSAEEAFYIFRDKYKISNTDIKEIRKIIAIRYAITKEGYSSTKPIRIATDIPREALAEFSELDENFPGINIIIESQRSYTSGNLASHILGYVDKINSDEYEKRKDIYGRNDVIGRTGIESIFEEFLKGKNGTKQIDMAVDGTITSEYISKEAVAGSDVVLTIDSNLQKITEDALERNINKIASGGFGKVYDTNAGACVVMNVHTGEILSMASYPDYNPQDFVGGISSNAWNSYITNEAKPLVNKASQNSYAPGSIFKMVTGIAALESGSVTLTEKINDTGIYTKYKDVPMKCWYYSDYRVGHGYVNISQAIEKSCNYFFYEVSDRMGIDNLAKYARYFGLGSKTGVELQSESAGVLASKETKQKMHPDDINWNPGNTLNAAIGQGDNEFTPLQMAKYISMLANGGKKIDVSLIKTIVKPDGTEYAKEEINSFVNQKLGVSDEAGEDLQINQNYLKSILEGMRSVTSDTGGTAYVRFKDFDIEVGGKTGSAEAPNNKVHAWFAGFAPFENPEIAIVVMVENGGHGNYTAEVVVDIMKEYFGMNTQNVQENLTAIPYTESIN